MKTQAQGKSSSEFYQQRITFSVAESLLQWLNTNQGEAERIYRRDRFCAKTLPMGIGL